jgi:hypothetical protein
VLEQTITFLEQNGMALSPLCLLTFIEALHEEGILLWEGDSAEVKIMKAEYDAGQFPTFEGKDVHSVAALMKLFLAELPKPLLIMTKGLSDIESKCVSVHHS